MHVPRPTRSRRVVARALGLGVSSLLAATLVAWAPNAVTGWSQGSAEATLWQLLNGARTNNGVAPLQQNATLVSLARWRSSDMLAKDYFSHTIAGCGCLVYTYYDSNGLSYDWAGENIGWNSGQTDSYSPVRVHEQFMGSPGHRKNVLDPSFTHGGVGAAAADNQMFQGYVQNTRMYTELFMQAKGSSTPAPPPSGGGGGGGSQPAPQPAQPAQPEPTPSPQRASVDAPARPVSTAGIDGVTEVVSRPSSTSLIVHHRIEELAAARVAATTPNTQVAVAAPTGPMEVAAVDDDHGGPFDGVIAALIGFLFG